MLENAWFRFMYERGRLAQVAEGIASFFRTAWERKRLPRKVVRLEAYNVFRMTCLIVMLVVTYKLCTVSVTETVTYCVQVAACRNP